MNRTIVLMLAVIGAGCDVEPKESQIKHCAINGYEADTQYGQPVECCTRNGGHLACMSPRVVTQHRDITFAAK